MQEALVGRKARDTGRGWWHATRGGNGVEKEGGGANTRYKDRRRSSQRKRDAKRAASDAGKSRQHKKEASGQRKEPTWMEASAGSKPCARVTSLSELMSSLSESNTSPLRHARGISRRVGGAG